MIIEIKDGVKFDTEKTFNEQSYECQQYLYGIMNSEQPDIRNDDFNRPIVETWFLRDELKDFAIVRESTYKSDEYNWVMTNQTIKIVEL